MMPTWLAGLIAVAAITVTYFSCVRPHLSGRGCAGSGSSVQDADLDARHPDAPRRPGLRLFIGVAAAVAVVAVVGHCEPNLSEPRASHTPHPLLSSLGNSEFTVNAQHEHLVDGSSTACHESMTSAVLPRSANVSVGHGAVMAVVAITGWQAQPAVLAGRGPPGALGAALTGQDLLRRFCLARR
jgi:lipoprotein LpqS